MRLLELNRKLRQHRYILANVRRATAYCIVPYAVWRANLCRIDDLAFACICERVQHRVTIENRTLHGLYAVVDAYVAALIVAETGAEEEGETQPGR